MENDSTIQTLKMIFASITGLVVHMLGGSDDLLTLFGALIGLDFVLGVLKGCKTGTFKSSIVRWGAVNKALEAVLIMVFWLFDNVAHTDIFRNGAIIWFCVCEAASIFENLAILGVPCPDGLRETLAKLKVGISINFVDIFNKLLEERMPMKKGEDDNDNQ